jgi:hypothetical protein
MQLFVYVLTPGTAVPCVLLQQCLVVLVLAVTPAAAAVPAAVPAADVDLSLIISFQRMRDVLKVRRARQQQ